MGMTYADAEAARNRIVLEHSLVSHEQHRSEDAFDPFYYESGRVVNRYKYVGMDYQDAFDWAAHLVATDGPYFRKTGSVRREQGNLWTVDVVEHINFDTANILFPTVYGAAYGVLVGWQFEKLDTLEGAPSGRGYGGGPVTFDKNAALNGDNRIHLSTDLVESGVKLNALFGVIPFRVQLIHERFKYHSMGYNNAILLANELRNRSLWVLSSPTTAPFQRDLISVRRGSGPSNSFEVLHTKVWPVDTRPQAANSGGSWVVYTVTAHP